MKILLTGATGYVGKRLLPVLIDRGHDIVCAVRDKNRLMITKQYCENVHIVEIDFLNPENADRIPDDIDVAFYLIHSMSSTTKEFDYLEEKTAVNFRNLMERTNVKQVIYLSGIANDKVLSKHIQSRNAVEERLKSSKYALTVLRAGIIVGSGSASFELIRDLVEKLPVMIAPKWLNTKSQPIAIRDITAHLYEVMGNKDTYNDTFDIGGPEVLTYKEMLMQYAEVRKLKRFIITIPFLTPRFSSYWLYFITSVSFKLAINLASSMKTEVVCKDKRLEKMLGIKPITYKDAIEKAFKKIEQNLVASSWKDSYSSSLLNESISHYVVVPTHGTFKDVRQIKVDDPEKAIDKIWGIGGVHGWYQWNILWKIRGYMDKIVGGVGLRRGRTNPNDIHTGDALDFWRVLYASKEDKRLLLYAEMKLPGEAWLEFNIDDDNILHQTATFRPLGLFGRIYWYSVLPFHHFIFKGMLEKIAL
jgi:uncharacterized protein YbjT (DUF2867 family)